VLLERLCALVPAPRRHLVTDRGVLAPAARDRRFLVPAVGEGGPGCRHGHGGGGGGGGDGGEALAADSAGGGGLHGRRRSVPHRPGKRRCGRPRYPWAELLRRVFWSDVLLCTHCGGPRRLLAAIHDPESIRRVLSAMGLPTEVPVLAPARAPPGPEWLW
jgi:hypothetical protein